MATKKTVAKKEVIKKAPAVKAVGKAKEVSAPKKEKKVVQNYELISFTIKATIPTQMYGNICPEITVKTRTLEEARAVVAPMIEDMYATYSHAGPDGHKASFVPKSVVTATERVVAVAPEKEIPPPDPLVPGRSNVSTKNPASTTASQSSGFVPQNPTEVRPERTPAYIKAENAIRSSMSLDALNLIEGQINNSVKLSAEEKSFLLPEVAKKRSEF